MTTAYVIMSGHYSDRMVETVFLDRDAAYEYVRRLNTRPDGGSWDEWDVDEVEVGSDPPANPYTVKCTIRDGVPGTFTYSTYPDDVPLIGTSWWYNSHAEATHCAVTVRSDSYERAQKALSERVAQTVADWDILRYAEELAGRLPPPPEPLADPMMVRPDWFCKECGRGPYTIERVNAEGGTDIEHWAGHAPSCGQFEGWRRHVEAVGWEIKAPGDRS